MLGKRERHLENKTWIFDEEVRNFQGLKSKWKHADKKVKALAFTVETFATPNISSWRSYRKMAGAGRSLWPSPGSSPLKQVMRPERRPLYVPRRGASSLSGWGEKTPNKQALLSFLLFTTFTTRPLSYHTSPQWSALHPTRHKNIQV